MMWEQPCTPLQPDAVTLDMLCTHCTTQALLHINWLPNSKSGTDQKQHCKELTPSYPEWPAYHTLTTFVMPTG